MVKRIALLDWDKTVHDGWTLGGWINYLVAIGTAPSDLVAEWQTLRQAHLASEIDHSAFAARSNETYAWHARGWSVVDIDMAAKHFVATLDCYNIFNFGAELMRWLVRRNIHPVIVTGAPTEVIVEHLALLNVPTASLKPYRVIEGLRLTVSDGKFTGEVESNPGTGLEKQRIANAFREHGFCIEIAAGDSSSDEPLLEAAKRQLSVGNPDLARRFGESCRLIDPYRTGAREMVTILEEAFHHE